MADWKDEKFATSKSYNYICPHCDKVVYYVPHGPRYEWKRHCPYRFCPWCGEKVGDGGG